MIVWLALFLLVIGISFLLAFRSMRDYQEIPEQSKLEYSLYLIRQTSNLTAETLQSIHDSLLKKSLVIAIERLFKGRESALCLFGPKEILKHFQELNLLELEDYTNTIEPGTSTIWEVGIKGGQSGLKNIVNPFKELPELQSDELFLWQVLVSGKQIQIRAGVFSKDPERRKQLAKALQSLAEGKLIKVPRPFSNDAMLNFYKQRSMDKGTTNQFSAEALMRLLTI